MTTRPQRAAESDRQHGSEAAPRRQASQSIAGQSIAGQSIAGQSIAGQSPVPGEAQQGGSSGASQQMGGTRFTDWAAI